MSYEYKKHAMVDGKKYGPTVGGRYYQPADYHGKVKDNNKKGRKAKNKEHEVKTHWVRTKSEQYDVFIEGENNEFIDVHGIFSLLDDCNEIMGDNEERLAFFPTPPAGTIDWHGYPIPSTEDKLTDEMIDKFLEKQKVGSANYSRLLRRDL